MKQNINPGAYGWRQPHWLNTYYPEGLPVGGDEDWRLSYFSNDFNAVLVPAGYWLTGENVDCESWSDAVHEDFQFFVECHVDMLGYISMNDLRDNLKSLQPQLSALVFLDEKQQMSETVRRQFCSLAGSMALDVFGLDTTHGLNVESAKQHVWRTGSAFPSRFAFIEDDLSDLRSVRKVVEDFASRSKNGPATIIADHPQLQASNLMKLRSVLEIMGY